MSRNCPVDSSKTKLDGVDEPEHFPGHSMTACPDTCALTVASSDSASGVVVGVIVLLGLIGTGAAAV
jgi:hypothetical protein